MDLSRVERIVHDGDEIVAIYAGNSCVWPDPWVDLWDDGMQEPY